MAENTTHSEPAPAKKDDYKVQIDFLKFSIGDTQAIIRALDAKLGIMGFFLLCPIGTLKSLTSEVPTAGAGNIFVLFTLIIFLVAWSLNVVAIFNAISPRENPSAHIGLDPGCQTSFFIPGKFKFTIAHIFFRPGRATRSRRGKSVSDALDGPKAGGQPPELGVSVDEFLTCLPKNDAMMAKELASVLLKISYIRDAKSFVVRHSFILLFIWLPCFLISWTYYSQFSQTDKSVPVDITLPAGMR